MRSFISYALSGDLDSAGFVQGAMPDVSTEYVDMKNLTLLILIAYRI